MFTAALVAIVTYLIYLWIKRTLTYWKDRGVNGPTPLPFLGNFGAVLSRQTSMSGLLTDLHNKYSGEKIVGFYRGFRPSLLIRDPEVLKQILIKDFSTFQDRGARQHDDDPFFDNLFGSEGVTWKVLRHKLTPIFTSNKLKNMIPLVENSVDEYMRYVQKLVDHGKDHEIKDLAAKYTLEAVGSCVFGVNMDTFTDAPNPFSEVSNKIFAPTFALTLLAVVDFFVPNTSKLMYKAAGISTINSEVKDFFLQLVDKIVKQREGKKKLRNDFMDLMIELKEQGTIDRKDGDKTLELEFTLELLAAQCFIFFFAGFETSASTMSFMMYELALNPEIQQRAYANVMAVMENNGGKITYDSISQLTYLEMCFDETLRKYPVVPSLIRKCSENYTIPNTKCTIEKDMAVFVSVMGLHKDPEYYKDPETFNPERFSPENKHNINRLVYLPFGEGPRNCIGMRFAKVQSMMGMANFISKFKLERSDKTPSHLEFNIDKGTLLAKEGIWLKISKRLNIYIF